MERKCCEICRYWSEMVAGFEGSGPVKALGAIDDPTCPGYDDEYPEDNCSMPFSGSMERKE